MSIVRGTLSVLCLFLISNYTFAQAPTIQDCLGAIPVCQDIYFETNAPIGNGSIQEAQNFDGCVPLEENSIWYTFTVNESGNFGFVITPNVSTDDYDWALFDITNSSCDNVVNNSSLVVSCNNAGSAIGDPNNCNGPTGATGATNANMTSLGCTPPNSPFNALVPVAQGNVYALFIVNWTGSPNGYEIDFGLGDAGIYDDIDPEVNLPLTTFDCASSGANMTQIDVTFTDYIQCSTVDPSNFIIDGPDAPYTVSINNSACNIGASYSQYFDINVTPAITGEFSISIAGTAQYEILDVCDNPSESFDGCNMGNSMTVACDDGNSETIYDSTTVITCDESIVCRPCQGICGTFYDTTIDLCEGDTAILNTGEIVWQAGIYETSFLAADGCDSIIRNFVSNLPSIGLQAPTIYYGFFDDVNILNTSVSIPNASYSWSPPDELSCTDCPDPEILASEFLDITYTLTVTDEDTGCEDTRLVGAFITDYNAFYIPTAFSPNGDGQNDVLNINYTGLLETFQFGIYNRWGELVFYTSDPDDTWDGYYKGQEQPISAFAYVVRGTFPNNVVIVDKGNITLIR